MNVMLFVTSSANPLIAQQDILNSGRDGTSQFTGIEDYIKRTVTGYSDPYFYKHFRISRMSFQVGHYLLNFEKMKVRDTFFGLEIFRGWYGRSPHF
jgi:hypothetical protein